MHSHNEILHRFVKLNKSKCQTAINELVLLGHVISRDGIKADPKKVHAISNLPQPANKTELQNLFGMLNYLGKFIPNLSIESANLRKLLEKDNEVVFYFILLFFLFTYLFCKHKYKFTNTSIQIQAIILKKNIFAGSL